jgi:hypothetical protein
VVETSIPAFAIAFLTRHIELAYRPLASPALLVFFVFIILSTLRLSWRISILSGVVASVTYLGAALYLGWRLPLPGAPAPFTQTGVTVNAPVDVLGYQRVVQQSTGLFHSLRIVFPDLYFLLERIPVPDALCAYFAAADSAYVMLTAIPLENWWRRGLLSRIGLPSIALLSGHPRNYPEN